MSLSSALSVALSGLETSTTLLQLAANNISNAQTPGFTEKSANVSSTVLGTAASGAEITGFNRATDSVLQQSFNTATANASYLGTQNNFMQQVQTIFDSTANNPALSNAMAQFSAAWTQLQASPEDPTVQQAVVQAGNAFAQQVNSAQTQINSLQAQVQTDTQNTVTQLNGDLTQLATLNQQIFTATGSNQPTGDLEDSRDQLINQISQIVNVNVVPRAQGEVALYTPDGVALLDSGSTEQFSYNGTSVTDSSGLDVTNDLTGGSLQAELQFGANTTPPSSTPGVNTIQKLQGQIQDLINAFTNGSAFATAYNPGLDPTEDFFTSTGGFSVNSSLLADPTTLTQDTAAATAATFTTDNNFSDPNSGLSLPNGTTTDLVNAILSGAQQAANSISTQSQSATQQQQFYQQSLSNVTGVNVDEELVNLTTLQNTYAASAHVISTIAEIFNDLMSTLA
jgi:flagellar hook-associated protein 1 FlgK